MSRYNMTICMLSKSDESGGGASRVAAVLSTLLRENGFSVTHFAKTNADHYSNLNGRSLNKFLYKGSKFVSKLIGLPDILTTEYLNLRRYELEKFKIFHCHDISSAISPLTLKKLSRFAPVIWTFHDCSPFTGGCIYPISCTRFVNQNCCACPQLGRWPLSTNIDFTGKMQSLKLALINNQISKIVCPSKWIADEAKRAGVPEKLISVIYNSTDTSLFIPEARQENEKLKILISSYDLNSPYKGGNHALKIINDLSINIDVIIIGKNGDDFKRRINPKHHIQVISQTFDKNILAENYRKADLLLHTATDDNCPLTIIESLSSGVPVIGFKTGGIPELVTSNVNGWLSEKGDATSSVQVIEGLHHNRILLADWKVNARKIAFDRFNNQAFLNNHISLYENTIKLRGFN